MSWSRHESKSSQIEAYGYHAPSQVLEITFRNSGRYHYHGVPQAAFDSFHGAESHGKHFHAHIRNNKDYQTARQKEAA